MKQGRPEKAIAQTKGRKLSKVARRALSKVIEKVNRKAKGKGKRCVRAG